MHPRLAAIAASNGGPFTRRQALVAGYTSKAIEHRLVTGRWIALRRGIYVDSSLNGRCRDAGREQALRVAVAAIRVPSAVGSHHSAALVHGLDWLTKPSHPVTVTVSPEPDHGHAAKLGAWVHRAGLPESHICLRHGARFTTPARTAIDLARGLPFREGVVAVDSALRSTPTTPTNLAAVLHDCQTWPGIRRAGEVVAFADGGAESALESVSRVVFAEQGLPAPITQVVISDNEPFARVDFLWPEYATIGEADGMVKYGDPEALRLEKLRQERLERAGYVVVRFTWNDIMYHPRETAARIRRAFAESLTRNRRLA